MAETSPPALEMVDPRIRRTRQMLHEALAQLLAEEGIEKISVSDITERATLNRATFYAHYPDKLALLEGMVAAQFQDLLTARSVVFDGSCRGALMSIILAVCDYLANLPGNQCPKRAQAEKYFESALVAAVRNLILGGMKKHPPTSDIPPELVAATVSGAVYSAAREWLRTENRVPADQIADSIFCLVSPMLG